MADVTIQVPVEVLTQEAETKLRSLGKILGETGAKFGDGAKQAAGMQTVMGSLAQAMHGPVGLVAGFAAIGVAAGSSILNFAASKQQLQLMADTSRMSTREFRALRDTMELAGVPLQQATAYVNAMGGAFKDMWMNRWMSKAGQSAMQYGDVAVASVSRVIDAMKGGKVTDGIDAMLKELKNVEPQYKDKMFEFWGNNLGIPAPVLEQVLEKYRDVMSRVTEENIKASLMLSVKWIEFKQFMRDHVWTPIADHAIEVIGKMLGGMDAEKGKTAAQDFVKAINAEIDKISTATTIQELKWIIGWLEKADAWLQAHPDLAQGGASGALRRRGYKSEEEVPLSNRERLLRDRLQELQRQKQRAPGAGEGFFNRLRGLFHPSRSYGEGRASGAIGPVLPQLLGKLTGGGGAKEDLGKALGIDSIQLEEKSRNTEAVTAVTSQVRELNNLLLEQLHGPPGGGGGGDTTAPPASFDERFQGAAPVADTGGGGSSFGPPSPSQLIGQMVPAPARQEFSVPTELQSQPSASFADRFQAAETPMNMAEGGVVRRRPGGTLIRVGEGRTDEAVVPLKQVAGELSDTEWKRRIERATNPIMNDSFAEGEAPIGGRGASPFGGSKYNYLKDTEAGMEKKNARETEAYYSRPNWQNYGKGILQPEGLPVGLDNFANNMDKTLSRSTSMGNGNVAIDVSFKDQRDRQQTPRAVPHKIFDKLKVDGLPQGVRSEAISDDGYPYVMSG